MKTKHALHRAQQRGIQANISELLQEHGDVKPAPKGCLVRYFSKKAIKEIEAMYGHTFIAKNHEKLRTYLIESREDGAVITIGKLYQNQRLASSKINRMYH